MPDLELDNIYKYHAPDATQLTKYESLRSNAKHLATLITTYCPDSRERSIALTHIETAVMWANASIARSK